MKNLITFTLLIHGLFLVVGCGSTKAPPSAASEVVSETEQTTQRSIGDFLKTKDELPVEERIALYHQLKRDSLSAYNFGEEEELNGYGYSLVFSGKPQEAIEIFNLLVSEFPNSSNPYDSLAETYQREGDEERAIINYEKSFALNPENDNAKFQVDVMKGTIDILETDTTWGKEMFKMPLRFAPEIKLEGIEDARFPRGWATESSDEFWTYVFAWNVNYAEEVTEAMLATNMRLYFNGLMSRKKGDLESPTVATFTKVGEAEGLSRFEGKVSFLDNFQTKGYFTLNIRAESISCPDRGKSVIVFRFSPKPFEHLIWDKVDQVRMLGDVCSL
jgi:tetratricopeptide (TPR) repeat protein